MSVYSATVLLLLVLDPLGNVPLFMVALKDVPPERRVRVVFRELCIALAVLAFFLFCGRFVLSLLQIQEPALSIAGGLILFLVAIRMIFPAQHDQFGEAMGGEPFIVPLAVPLVAGPSAMATVLLMVSREPERWPQWAIALGVAWALTAAILVSSSGLSRRLGQRGLIALERLMGMILTTIAVQMFLTGIQQFLASASAPHGH
jgi:multiple antibiotic resistance protein